MTDDTMIERLARASYERKVGRQYTWDLASEGIRDTWRTAVECVLQELREPPARLIEVGRQYYDIDGSVETAWQAMLDHILSQ